MDSDYEAANSRPGGSSNEQVIAQGASDTVKIPKPLSDILATANPSPKGEEKFIVFEYLPRQGKCESCTYVIMEERDTLQNGLSFFQLACSSLALLMGKLLYQLGISVTGWGHVQLVLLERCPEFGFRGKTFGITNHDDNTVILHRNKGKDWIPSDKASYAFGGCTSASEADVQKTADQMVSGFKKDGQKYGLIYFNCETFSYDLAALICSHESRLKLFRFWFSSAKQREKKIKQSLLNAHPGYFYYENRGMRLFRMVLAWVWWLWYGSMISSFYSLTPSDLSIIQRLEYLRRPGKNPFMVRLVIGGSSTMYAHLLLVYFGRRLQPMLWIPACVGSLLVVVPVMLGSRWWLTAGVGLFLLVILLLVRNVV